MEDKVQIFSNPEFGEVRVLGDFDNPLFCLADVCRVLELDASQVMKRHEDGVVSIHPIPDSLGRMQNTNFVNEDGLYDVILDSRKPNAKKFRKWLTGEVVPSIRKTGSYSVASIDPLAHAISELAAVEREKLALEREKFNVENSEETKTFAKAQLLRDIASSSRDYFLRDKLLSEATKLLMGEDFFNDEQPVIMR